jgi:carboxymethylenebutenolidase
MGAAAPRWIDIGPDAKFKGLYVEAAAAGQARGGIVLVQEIFGVNANMRATAQAFAEQGYAVLVPDLFWRTEPGIVLDPSDEQQRQRAMKLNESFDDAAGLADLGAAVAALRQASGSAHVFSVGYCLGGRLSFALGARGDVARAVAYYGVNLARYAGAEVRSPVLAHVAQNDALCPPQAQQQLAKLLKDTAQVRLEVHAGVGHAFSRLGSPAYVAATAERAMEQTLAFLGGAD